MKFKKAIILTLSMVFLYSCGVGGAIQGNKRSKNSDEFLVEKKNPLTKPPDINKLPVPLDQEEEEKSDSIDIKKILEIDDVKNTTKISNGDQKGLEQTVLEQINK